MLTNLLYWRPHSSRTFLLSFLLYMVFKFVSLCSISRQYLFFVFFFPFLSSKVAGKFDFSWNTLVMMSKIYVTSIITGNFVWKVKQIPRVFKVLFFCQYIYINSCVITGAYHHWFKWAIHLSPIRLHLNQEINSPILRRILFKTYLGWVIFQELVLVRIQWQFF